MSSFKQSKRSNTLNSDLDVEEKNEATSPGASTLGVVPQDSLLKDSPNPILKFANASAE